MRYFKAPWGTSLIVMSLLATGICLGVAVFHWQPPTPENLARFSFWLSLLPIVAVVGCALFCVRGYTIGPDALMIQRLFWQTRIPLAGLKSVEARPRAMSGSIRTFGNGGLFSFSGYYRSKALGSYRAFVTDFDRTAILHFPERTIVLSPDAPEEFVAALSSNLRGV